MPLNTWLIYVAAVLVLTVTPGPSVLMTISTSVNRGLRQAILAALGSTSAIVCIMALSALGLGALLAASETLFSLLKWAGAAYLAYLGISSLLSSRSTLAFSGDERSGGNRNPGNPEALSGAFLWEPATPRHWCFLPRCFRNSWMPRARKALQFLVLGATFVAFELFWLCTYAALGVRARHWLQAPGRALMFNRATGGVFLLAAGCAGVGKTQPGLKIG